MDFDGVSHEEVLAGGSGLYEVVTSSGVPVRLHDMSLVRLDHDPERRSLVVEFLYDDPRWTPETAHDTPLAIFAFDGVEVVQQQDEPAEEGTPDEVLGQVSAFDYDPASGVFALSAYTTSWVFTTSRLALTVRTGGRRSRQESVRCLVRGVGAAEGAADPPDEQATRSAEDRAYSGSGRRRRTLADYIDGKTHPFGGRPRDGAGSGGR